ncbi:MAG: hypothetical protein A2104_05895 [Candidatus Melainabacteria bacterium GWF2_32_7]|nr:MAG: hypothetical protein A2104_05895 [Candidatus Melainabacteria bacterium GWF2_32_7]
MEKDKHNQENNLLTLKFKSGVDNQIKSHTKINNNQSNPIYKSLFKFIHTELKDDKTGKPFSRFNPKDLL